MPLLRYLPRQVCVIGYFIISLALFLFVQAQNVFPQLLLARLLFSIGGAAVSTMVTAILPAMTFRVKRDDHGSKENLSTNANMHTGSFSISSEGTITPERRQADSPKHNEAAATSSKVTSPSRLAGLVGLFTGLGALIALTLFLPLPARLGDRGLGAGEAVRDSYYIVGGVALAIAIVCFFGLRGLPVKGRALIQQKAAYRGGDRQHKGWQAIYPGRALGKAIQYGFTDPSIGLSYIGGFVARASSVAISLFIPLSVNAYFISRGDCGNPAHEIGQIKEHCRQAYIISSQLTGVSQLVALIFAPIFGYIAEKYILFNFPLILGASAGIVGYMSFAYAATPDPKATDGSGWIFVSVALIGISQIAAIVVSLGILGRCVTASDAPLEQLPAHLRTAAMREDISDENHISRASPEDRSSLAAEEVNPESQSLLGHPKISDESKYDHKGAIAGVYSLAGGAGILLLTKLGGYLFDVLSPKTPFIMLSIFNAVLLLACLARGAFGHAEQD